MFEKLSENEINSYLNPQKQTIEDKEPEMTDEEFNYFKEVYTTTSEEGSGISKKNELLNSLSLLCVQSEHIIEKIDRLKDEINDTNDLDSVFNKIVALAKQAGKIEKEMFLIPATYGIRDKKEYVEKGLIESAKVDFYREDNRLVIKLPEMLPHRPHYDTASKTMKYYYDADKWKSKYFKAFQKEFEFGKQKIFNEKVTIIFMHHVTKDFDVADTDNFETKPIIDIITNFVLRDDSHRFVCYFMDVREDVKKGEDMYTEIIVCPLRNFHEYVEI